MESPCDSTKSKAWRRIQLPPVTEPCLSVTRSVRTGLPHPELELLLKSFFLQKPTTQLHPRRWDLSWALDQLAQPRSSGPDPLTEDVLPGPSSLRPSLLVIEAQC